MTTRILQRNGYQVYGAATYQQALSLPDDHDIQLLLTDVVMPGMSGRDLAERILAHRPKTVVVYMSGYSAGVLGPRLGLDDNNMALIQKPFLQQALLKKVHDALPVATMIRPPASGPAQRG